MPNKQQWIEQLELQPHIEGGYYREILKSDTVITNEEGNARALYTSIYFLLEEGNPSHFHRLKSDEVWYFHAGNALTVHLLMPDGTYQAIRLGTGIANGEQLQAVVPKGTIFGSTVDTPNGYALVSCMVSPGSDFADFELMKRHDLIGQYPNQAALIETLCRQ